MSDDESLVEEFFSEVNDKYYPQVLEGIDLLDEQQISEGVEALSRPLHTIKGVTGFMSGFEPASEFTHHVESFLKKMQAGEVGPEIENIALAIEAVNNIFMMIENLRNTGAHDPNQAQEIVDRLNGAGPSAGDSTDAGNTEIDIEEHGDAIILRVGMRRLHLPAHRDAICEALGKTPEGSAVLIDLSRTASVGSAVWEDIAGFTSTRFICAASMGNTSKETFYSWGFDRVIKSLEDEAQFLAEFSKEDSA